MILTKISKSNKSLIITIPREIVHKLELKPKDYLSVTSEDENKLCFEKVKVTPMQVFKDGENITDQINEPFVDIKKDKKKEDDKKNW